jgi:hypothetical protein
MMGMIIESNGKEVWSPSLRVGNLFFDQVRAMERVLDQKSGVDSYLDDTLEIDPITYNAFIESALRTLENTNNAALIVMSMGLLEVAIALNAKIHGEWPHVSVKLLPLVANAKNLIASLPP